jgi:PHD/YefM family antitoxin component YafN of YafNO toxin-antitoxin module
MRRFRHVLSGRVRTLLPSRQSTIEEGHQVHRVEVANSELRTVRDAMRQLNHMVDALERGDSEKFVLTQRNRMRAVVLSVEQFAEMQSLCRPADAALSSEAASSAHR